MKLSEQLIIIANGNSVIDPDRHKKWIIEMSEQAALMEKRLAASAPNDPIMETVKDRLIAWRSAKKRHAVIIMGLSNNDKTEAQKALDVAERQLMIIADNLK